MIFYFLCFLQSLGKIYGFHGKNSFLTAEKTQRQHLYLPYITFDDAYFSSQFKFLKCIYFSVYFEDCIGT